MMPKPGDACPRARPTNVEGAQGPGSTARTAIGESRRGQRFAQQRRGLLAVERDRCHRLIETIKLGCSQELVQDPRPGRGPAAMTVAALCNAIVEIRDNTAATVLLRVGRLETSRACYRTFAVMTPVARYKTRLNCAPAGGERPHLGVPPASLLKCRHGHACQVEQTPRYSRPAIARRARDHRHVLGHRGHPRAVHAAQSSQARRPGSQQTH